MRRSFVLVALAAALVGSACPADAQRSYDIGHRAELDKQAIERNEEQPSKAYAKALAALKAKHYRAASRALGDVVDAVPNNPTAWRLLGVAYAGEARWMASRRAYERALHLTPEDILSHAGRGVALLALNDPRAQAEADWLKSRGAACAGACSDASLLQVLAMRGPFAAPAS